VEKKKGKKQEGKWRIRLLYPEGVIERHFVYDDHDAIVRYDEVWRM
jgi:hypothetical protein